MLRAISGSCVQILVEIYTAPAHRPSLQVIVYRTEEDQTEEKAKVVAAVWGTYLNAALI